MVQDLFYADYVTTYYNANNVIKTTGIFCIDAFTIFDSILCAKLKKMDPNFVAKISIDSGMNSLKICVQILDELDIVQEPGRIPAIIR
jgi:hypothetical protein